MSKLNNFVEFGRLQDPVPKKLRDQKACLEACLRKRGRGKQISVSEYMIFYCKNF